jgi:signal transduction histidine kinase
MGYTRTYEGNGIGLALVFEYCKLNKATISAKSTKGKGSTFTVRFANYVNKEQN